MAFAQWHCASRRITNSIKKPLIITAISNGKKLATKGHTKIKVEECSNKYKQYKRKTHLPPIQYTVKSLQAPDPNLKSR